LAKTELPEHKEMVKKRELSPPGWNAKAMAVAIAFASISREYFFFYGQDRKR